MALTGPTQQAAIQAAVNAGAAQQHAQRMPGWNMQGIPPHMLGGLAPPNFFHQMQAAMVQENAISLVAATKLGNSTKNPASNSGKVVRSSVRKLNPQGTLVTVGQWAKKVTEENLDWLVKLAKRHHPKEDMVILAYGDGYETLVLFDGAIDKIPSDFSSIKKIAIGVSVADADSKLDEAKLANLGIIQCNDSIWEHLRFQQMDNSPNKKDKFMFLHTSNTVFGGSIDGRQRVFQVKTKAPCTAVKQVSNPVLEQQIVALWKGQTFVPVPGAVVAAVAAPAAASLPQPVLPKAETVITFNPKELILLEKAFDNNITNRDFKTDVNKFTSEDKKKCQSVIYRATSEIVTTTKKRRKKTPGPDKKPAAAAKPAPAAASPKKKTPAKKGAPKTSPAKAKSPAKSKTPKAKPAPKKDDKADSDDEPISKLKPKSTPKAAAKSPAKSATKKGTKTTPKKKETPASKKRGRPSKAASEKEPETKKPRGRSKSKTKK